MKKEIRSFVVAAASVSLVFAASAWTPLVWANRDSDMNAASSWNDLSGNVSSVAPSSDTVLFFSEDAVVQPVLTQSMTAIGLCFAAYTNNFSASIPTVNINDGKGGYNYSGYRITGVEGATLTLDGNTYNNGWTRDLNMLSKGTNSIAVPVVFTDNRAHYLNVSGGRFVFESPVSTRANSNFTTDAKVYGRVVFAAPNPDFVPKTLVIYGTFAIAHPRAVEAVPAFYSSCWGWGTSYGGFASEKNCRFENETDEPAVITAATFEIGDHDGFNIDGGPFPMSNTVLRASMRDGKSIGGSSNWTVKEIVCTAGAGRTFNKNGSGTLINLGGFCAGSAYTNIIQVSAGTYVAMLEEGLSPYRNIFNCNTYPDSPIGARIGVNFDYAPVNSDVYDNGLLFYHYRRPSGFAAMGGVRHVKLYNGELLCRALKHPVLEGDYRQFCGQNIALGAEGTDGTVVLDNDIDLNNDQTNGSYNENYVSVWDGEAFVDARLAGMVTNAPAARPSHLWVRFSKKEDGVLALDGPCYTTCDGRVYAGGLLVNNTVASKYIVYDGAWIGGTGKTLGLEIQSGGALRPGELGGDLEVSGAVSFADGAKIIADLGPDKAHGCAYFTGSGVALEAVGAVTVELNPLEGLEGGGKVKILDWSGANATSATAFDIDRYSLSYDEEHFVRASFSVQDEALYLSYSTRTKHPTLIRIR